MKKFIKYMLLLLALPVLLQAQYTGGDGSGDTYISLTNVHLPVNKIESETPTKYELYQNSPNPFNPVTIIHFDLSKPGEVLLKIFDINGREIAILVNEKLFAGKYEVSWNGSNYTSGVYFYKLETENFINTKRMILLK